MEAINICSEVKEKMLSMSKGDWFINLVVVDGSKAFEGFYKYLTKVDINGYICFLRVDGFWGTITEEWFDVKGEHDSHEFSNINMVTNVDNEIVERFAINTQAKVIERFTNKPISLFGDDCNIMRLGELCGHIRAIQNI